MENKGNLHLYSIMRLDEEHIDEYCEDMRLQTASFSVALLFPRGILRRTRLQSFVTYMISTRKNLMPWGFPAAFLFRLP